MSITLATSAAASAIVRHARTGQQRVYACDAAAHLVVIGDAAGRAVGAFGGRGTSVGRLDTPLDAVLVHPNFGGEPLGLAGIDTSWLAVADYGNCRVQLFELDGAFVAALPLHDDRGRPWAPCALAWRAPFLDVSGVDGARSRLYLSAALLAGDPAVWGRTAGHRRGRAGVRH